MITRCRDCGHQKCSCDRTEYTVWLTREQRDCLTFAFNVFIKQNNIETNANPVLFKHRNDRWNAVARRVNSFFVKQRVSKTS